MWDTALGVKSWKLFLLTCRSCSVGIKTVFDWFSQSWLREDSTCSMIVGYCWVNLKVLNTIFLCQLFCHLEASVLHTSTVRKVTMQQGQSSTETTTSLSVCIYAFTSVSLSPSEPTGCCSVTPTPLPKLFCAWAKPRKENLLHSFTLTCLPPLSLRYTHIDTHTCGFSL